MHGWTSLISLMLSVWAQALHRYRGRKLYSLEYIRAANYFAFSHSSKLLTE